MIAAVTVPEDNLLTLARAAVGEVSPVDFHRLLVTSVEPPGKLGPTSRRLLSQVLSRGLVLALARGGGWRKLQGKRLWERREAPPLAFTGNLIHLLQWMLRTPLGDADVPALVLKAPLTPAEEAVLLLLFSRLQGSGCEATVARQAPLRDSPLCVLAFAGELARHRPLEKVPPVSVEQHGVFIEGLSDVLSSAWLRVERLRPGLERPTVAITIGEAQAAALESFFEVIDRAGRRDLAGFLLDAAVVALEHPLTATEYVASLNQDTPLRERTEARRAAGALLRGVGRLRAWDAEHRAVRFIDDGYDLAQELVRAWERLGDRGFRAAERIVSELEAL